MDVTPKIMPPLKAAVASFSPRLVPTKAMVKPVNNTHIPSKPHFHQFIRIPRSSIQALNPRTKMVASIPSINQNNPLLKNFMTFSLEFNNIYGMSNQT
jgi:hypothetical protein